MSKASNEMRERFVDAYCEHGDARRAALDAGYKEGKYISNQACNLKRQLGSQIQKRMQEKFVDHTPNAFKAMKELMSDSLSDTVKFQCAKDLMDRAGFKATDKLTIEEDKKTVPELEAELVSLVGRDKANLLLNKKPVSKATTANPANLEESGWIDNKLEKHELSDTLN